MENFLIRGTSAFDFYHTSSDELYHYNKEKNKIEPVYNLAFSSSKKPFRQYVESNNYFLTNVFEKNKIVATNSTF